MTAAALSCPISWCNVAMNHPMPSIRLSRPAFRTCLPGARPCARCAAARMRPARRPASSGLAGCRFAATCRRLPSGARCAGGRGRSSRGRRAAGKARSKLALALEFSGEFRGYRHVDLATAAASAAFARSRVPHDAADRARPSLEAAHQSTWCLARPVPPHAGSGWNSPLQRGSQH